MRTLVFRISVLIAPACVLAIAVAPLGADSGPAHQAAQTPPIKLGTSGSNVDDASHAFCCGGTLGSLITRDDQPYILSNNHVLAISGAASPGGDVIQPGLIDVQCDPSQTITVGTFAGDLVPLGTANVDVALALANGNVDTTGAILDIGRPCTTTQEPAIGLMVTKSGRTTGQTFGSVQAVNVTVQITYQRGCHQHKKFRVLYTNQVTISPAGFSGPGDSGSLIVSDDGTPNPVGLLYAGSSTLTAANPIADVVGALSAGGHSVAFVGQACAPPAATIGVMSPQGSRGPSPSSIAAARAVKERHEPALFARPELIGAGVGADDADPTQAVIVLYVESPNGAAPRGLPGDLDGVKVKVVPTEPLEAF